MRPIAAAAVVAGLPLAGRNASQAAAPPRLAALDQPVGAEDALPDNAGVPLEQYANLRHIGQVDDVPFYAAPGPADRLWCLVMVLDGPVENDAFSSGSCSTDDHFALHGLNGSTGRPDATLVSTTLLPDVAGQLGDGFAIIGPNPASPTRTHAK
ncbi:hypothetical protein [Georgenia ruanii]|uniref:hypothetical protein n=1 Tax=Georgenia ruanii TaxID=348442 RepID=UPI00126501C1|nr:hypothetical protein [Georgenia ruanii]